MALKFAVNNSLSAITSLPSGISGGALNLISTQTASASASIEFTTGIDSTYDVYVFKLINIHPSTNSNFTFNLSTDGGSNYNVTKTSTNFGAYHTEGDNDNILAYDTNQDLAQSTAYQNLTMGGAAGANQADRSFSGTLILFNPSNTTFVKHFISNSNFVDNSSVAYTVNAYVAGYGNTTSAINAIDFKYASGNIDDGIIKMYGVK